MALVKVPGHIPQKGGWNDDHYLKNPSGTNPYPYPGSMPEGMWQQTPFVMKWTTTGLPAGVAARSVWASPIFDTLPNMRGSMTGSGSSGNGGVGAQPIWIQRGAMGKLWIQITGLDVRGWSRFGLRVTAQEHAHILDPSNTRAVTPAADITTEFAGTQPSCILQFYPTGAGYPVRFWKVEVTFDMLKDLNGTVTGWPAGQIPAPEWRLGAAYY